MSIETRATLHEHFVRCGSFLFPLRKERVMKDNKFATNKGGVIKAPKATGKGDPKATVTKGNDLRNGTKKN